MKVNEANAELIDYSKRLTTKLKNETNKKENDIENLNQIYEEKIEETKSNGENKLISRSKVNEDRLNLAAKDYEDKLKNYQSNLDKTKIGLDQEELNLKNNLLQKVSNIKKQNENDIHDQFINATNTQEAVSDSIKNAMLTMKDKELVTRRQLETNAKNEMSNLSSEYDIKNRAAEQNYRNQLKNELLTHKEDIAFQKTELDRDSLQNSEKNKRIISEKAMIQTEEISYLDKHQKDVLNQKQNDFKIRYENLIKEHNHILSELKTHFDADVKKMLEQTSSQKKIIASRSDDAFYKIETIVPKTFENEKEYMVSLNVPMHEKENVHLSVRGRGVKMTLTRRFAEAFDDQEGNINRSTKSELFSREFACKDLLNPKLVDQKYENGVLTYRIQKL